MVHLVANGSAGENDGVELRCSDVDRERVAEALRGAAEDGRLTLAELEERLEATFQARTYGDLQPITRDLPQGPYPVPGNQPPSQWTPGRQASQPASSSPDIGRSERITAVLSDEKRVGRWEVPDRVDVMTVCGDAKLDFTEAIVRSSEVVISGAVVLGKMTIIVPEDADVRFENSANILGERKSKLQQQATSDGPIFRIRSLLVLGEISVRPSKNKGRRPFS